MPTKKVIKPEIGKIEEPQETRLAPLESQIVMPVVSPEQARKAWDMFQATKKALLDQSDYQVIVNKTFKGGHWGTEKKPFVKKSGWRKLATAFNISDEVIKEERKVYDLMPYKTKGADGKDVIIQRPGFVFEMSVKAIAPNGRYATGVGSCASNERGFAHLEHDTRATAMTRAKNRAISDLIGGGEVSAEEMEQQVNAVQEGCNVDHELLETRNVQKEGKNKGRPFKYCKCGWGRWEDTKVEWNQKPIEKKKEEENE